MYRRIMVAVDETDTASRAVHEAIGLAHSAGAEVLFVHVGADMPGEKALGWAAELARRAGVKGGTARVALDGGVGPTLVREAERWTADLIVVGRHDRGALERLVLGSVGEAVVRAAAIPVLLVRRNTLLAPTKSG